MRDDLTAVTTPTRTADGRYTIDVPDGWQQGRGAFGGLVIANLIRAAEATVAAPDRPLRSLTAAICGPVVTGPADIDVEILRAGSGSTTVAARLVQDGAVQAHGVGILGRSRARDLDWAPANVVIASWKDAPVSPIAPPFGPTFAPHFEFRSTGPLPFSGAFTARAAGWIRPRRPGPARDAAYLAACIDAYWPCLLARLNEPRPAATVAFSLQITGDPGGLDPDAPLYYEAESPSLHEGYAVELRTLRGADGRLLALNQQTFTVIK
jgi:hypothetical protein